MATLAFDMDEVITDTLAHQLAWLERNHAHRVDRTALHGKKPHDLVPAALIKALEAHMHAGEFFADIPLMPGAEPVLRDLAKRHALFITTAAMDYPRSCNAKFDWLRIHLPFIPKDNFVFCGDKSIIRADFLIDDSPRHLERFTGTPLLFEAPHNVHETRFERVRDWPAIARRLAT